MISKLVCSLVGTEESVRVVPGTAVFRAYGAEQAREQFACNYGLNPEYQARLFQGDLLASAFGPAGEVRALELRSLPFFLATLYLPQMRSSPQQPHPLIQAFLQACAGR